MVSEGDHNGELTSNTLTEKGKRQMVERFVACFNAFDVYNLLTLLQPDARFMVNVEGTEIMRGDGVAMIRRQLEEEGVCSSSRKKTVLEYYQRGDRLVVELRYSRVLAKAEGDLRVGDTVNYEGVAEVRFRRSLIAEIVESYGAPRVKMGTS